MTRAYRWLSMGSSRVKSTLEGAYWQLGGYLRGKSRLEGFIERILLSFIPIIKGRLQSIFSSKGKPHSKKSLLYKEK